MAQIQSPAITQERLVIPNKYGEKLVGVLEEAGSKKLVILCHGLRSSKEEKLIVNLAAGLTRQGFSVFRFDFSGNGESEGEGEFQFGNYRKERDDLRAVVLYLSQKKYEINAIVGHSKGATSVLLYASTYHDVGTVISASGRFALGKGLEERLGKGFVEKIEKDGFIDVKDGTVVTQERLVIPNYHGEKLVGVLEEAGSKKLVILCHGLTSSKEEKLILNLATGLTGQGFSVFRFDFSGNGESEGEFQFANFQKERDDLRAVVLHLSERKYEISAIVGHSKGATSVLFYASTYSYVGTVISASGLLRNRCMEKIEKDGFIDVKDGTGKVVYRVTEKCLETLNIDIRSECLSIAKECRFLIVHGTADEVVPVEEAYELAKNIANHKIHIIQGADHCYTAHQDQWISAVVDFLKSQQV